MTLGIIGSLIAIYATGYSIAMAAIWGSNKGSQPITMFTLSTIMLASWGVILWLKL